MNGILHRENWIGALPVPVRAEFEARLRSADLAAGQPLYTAGDPARGMFQVEQGYLRLTGLQEDGRQVLITLYGPGACFAETAVVARRAFNHTVTAMTAATVSLLPEADFWQLYDRFPEIADALCRKFAETITRQLAARESRAAQRLGQRIAAIFVDLAERPGVVAPDGGTTISLPLTHTDIAEFFDVTRQSVQREMTVLKQTGGLSKSRGVWRIRDVRALRNC